MKKNIAIIGAGVIGLTSAIRLLEKGYNVSIFARDIDSNMTSRAAPAIWSPYKAAPEDLILKWAKRGLEVYQDFPAGNGVQEIESMELFNKDSGMPLWSKIIKNFKTLSPSEMPDGYVKGYSKQTFVIDTTIIVDYLQTQVKKLGAKIFQKEFKKIPDVDTEFKIIINCSGVWSNQLVPDEETFPISGQYISLQKPAGLNKILFAAIDDDGYILIVPRAHDCYVGGTTVLNDWNTEVNKELTENILQRAKLLEPKLNDMKILKTSVGLRPGRKTVRLEAEKISADRTVIHNYGHGGSGFTVSWGCADDVVDLCATLD
jgi:D-amino-acid oxidase